MDFEIWSKLGSGPYRVSSLEELFDMTDCGVILAENQEEKEILEGLQYLFGKELDIRIVEPTSSMNPWVYNRVLLFYTFNPLERAGL